MKNDRRPARSSFVNRHRSRNEKTAQRVRGRCKFSRDKQKLSADACVDLARALNHAGHRHGPLAQPMFTYHVAASISWGAGWGTVQDVGTAARSLYPRTDVKIARSMVAGLSKAPATAIDPHVRPLDPWRDGPAVANLLELAFRDEIGSDSSGQRMIHMLRHYSPLDALVGDDMRGFVWVEQGQIVGNVSLQRNPTRRDTWVIGNVATHPAWRNRGISTALIHAAIAFARSRQGRFVALQVVEGNTPALRVYERAGFRALGAVTHYRRPSVRAQSLPLLPDASAVRRARRADRDAVWTVARFNIPDHLTYAEPFDASTYRLDWRWWVSNLFNGWREQWLVRDAADHPADAGSQSIVGAIRTRVNFDLSEHHVELMLDARASVEDGVSLLVAGLRRFEEYVSRPLYCAQSRPHEATHGALQAVGFQPTRTLVHMAVEVEE